MSGNQHWTEHQDANGRTYYYNSLTNTSRWDKPDNEQSLAQIALEQSDWKEYTDQQTERKYYHNAETQETTWECPEEYQILLDRVTAEIKASLTAAAPKEYAPVGMEFRSKEEAQVCFNEMLQDIGVQPNWTWEMTVRRGYSHKFFKSLKSVNDRKQAFDYYIRSLKEKQMRDLNEQAAEDEDLLRSIFESKPEITASSSYAEICDLLEGNSDFESVGNLNRRIFFQKYIKQLKEEEKEKAREDRKRNIQKLKDILPSLNLKLTTTWSEFQELYKPYFEDDPSFQKLEPLDIFIVFEEELRGIDGRATESFELTMNEMDRKERIDREEFRNLLKELKDNGHLDINSKWKDIYPHIKDDNRYLNIVGNSGSSPLELFWDEIMIMEDLYRPDRRMIFDIVGNSRFAFSVETSFNEFSRYFERDFRKINPEHVKIAYEEFLYKAKKTFREEKRHDEKKNRHRIDAFKYYLRHLSPSIKINDTWEVVQKRCSGPEYNALSESERLEAFDKVIRRLKDKKVHVPDNDLHPRKKKARTDRGSSSEEEGELMG